MTCQTNEATEEAMIMTLDEPVIPAHDSMYFDDLKIHYVRAGAGIRSCCSMVGRRPGTPGGR